MHWQTCIFMSKGTKQGITLFQMDWFIYMNIYIHTHTIHVHMLYGFSYTHNVSYIQLLLHKQGISVEIMLASHIDFEVLLWTGSLLKHLKEQGSMVQLLVLLHLYKRLDKLLAPGFGSAQFQLLWLLGEWTSTWIISLLLACTL